MADLVTTLWQKAYMLEFDEDAFTFSVPPENEELSYSQRKTETKTFGGLHIDDYGIDTVKIVLSGSTINQSLKKIYGAGYGDKKLSGEDEILYLRDLLTKYKDIAENREKPVYLYDLSKTGKMGNSWQVAIGDFKIKRSNDRPFTYKYSIEFTGWKTEKNHAVSDYNKSISVSDITALTNLKTSVITTIQRQEALLEKTEDIKKKIESVTKELESYKGQIPEDKITVLQEEVQEIMKQQKTLKESKTAAEDAGRSAELDGGCKNCPQKNICGK